MRLNYLFIRVIILLLVLFRVTVQINNFQIFFILKLIYSNEIIGNFEFSNDLELSNLILSIIISIKIH